MLHVCCCLGQSSEACSIASQRSNFRAERRCPRLRSRGQAKSFLHAVKSRCPCQQSLRRRFHFRITVSPAQLQTLEEAFAAERARAFLWEYRYLNYFLARSSQRVLDWLAGLSVRTTVGTFEAFWLPILPIAQERQAIVTALQAHYLIVLAGELIEVTPKGREYLQWRGPLPDEAA